MCDRAGRMHTCPLTSVCAPTQHSAIFCGGRSASVRNSGNTAMTATIAFALGFLASLLANYFLPPFRSAMDGGVAWLCHLLNPGRFDLTGKWRQTFREPTNSDPSQWEDIEETVTLRHLGNRVTGRGETQDNHRVFRYSCRVQHDLVFGTYVKKGERGNTTGSGMVQLVVTPDRLQMHGYATWFDHDTERIESSKVVWKRS